MTDTISTVSTTAAIDTLPIVTEYQTLGRDLAAWYQLTQPGTNIAPSAWIDGQWRELFGVWTHLDEIVTEFGFTTPNPNERADWITQLDKLGNAGTGLGEKLLDKMNQLETFWVAIRYVADPKTNSEFEDAWTFVRAAEPVRVLMPTTVAIPT